MQLRSKWKVRMLSIVMILSMMVVGIQPTSVYAENAETVSSSAVEAEEDSGFDEDENADEDYYDDSDEDEDEIEDDETPMMIPIACFSFIIPEFTKPITITVVADEDWITLVTPVPSATPFSGVFVIL